MSEIIGAVLKTLMALLGVVAVVGISYGAIQNNKNGNHLAEVSLLAANIQAAVQSGTFSNLTVASVLAGQKGDTLAPMSMISGDSMINPWNGDVTVAVNPGNASQFIVTTTNVSTGGCSKLASNLNALAISVGGTALTVPVDELAARIACDATNSNTLAITFGH